MGSRTCLFCGDIDLSREHVFAQWLLEALDVRKKQMGMEHYTFFGMKLGERPLSLGSLINGLVCRGCNNGWMSRLESSVKPILLGVIRNADTRETIHKFFENNELVSKWAFKTAIMLNYASNYRNIVPRRHFRYLYNHDRIPENVYVLIGFTDDIKEEIDWVQSPMVMHLTHKEARVHERPRFKDLYKITLKVDKLMLKVIYSPFYDFKYKLDDNNHIMIHPYLGISDDIEKAENLLSFDIKGSVYEQDRNMFS